VRPYLEKNPSQKRADGVAQDVGHSNPSRGKKKQKQTTQYFLPSFHRIFLLPFTGKLK
jgi:hypothetical protein